MPSHRSDDSCRLLIACPDSRGIVAAVANLIADLGGNIVDADQHSEPAQPRDPGADPARAAGGPISSPAGQHGFFMRMAFDLAGAITRERFEQEWRPLADRFAMHWWLDWGRPRRRVVILASRQTHCLDDLLWRWRRHELVFDLPAVISNHDDGREFTELCGVPFVHLPVDESRADEQAEQLGVLLDKLAPDLIVLARYMRILPRAIVDRYAGRIINIHHSFLPAFIGARPYHQAYERGVKLIGATSHYVTHELDQGPIIAQATHQVTHRNAVDDLVRIGRDLERQVLCRAIDTHLDDRVIIVGNRTIVFD